MQFGCAPPQYGGGQLHELRRPTVTVAGTGTRGDSYTLK
jgi:hypothetical protein